MNGILLKVVDNNTSVLGEGKTGAGGEKHGCYREGVSAIECR